MAAETRNCSVHSLQEVMEQYLSGPESEELYSPFPPGTRVLHVVEDENGLTFIMSGEFFTLMGVDMSVASCCIAKTVCEYADVSSVVLSDELESIRLEARPDHYLLSNDITNAADESFTVYFSDMEHRYLIGRKPGGDPQRKETESYVMRRCLKARRVRSCWGSSPRERSCWRSQVRMGFVC